MTEKTTSWEDYQSGYRQAVCDLIPYPNQKRESSGIFIAYLIGLIVGALVFKYTRE